MKSKIHNVARPPGRPIPVGGRAALRRGLRRFAVAILAGPVALAAACDAAPTAPTTPPPTPTPYDHNRSPGASAADILSATDYDSLVVEIHHFSGLRPTDEGLQILEDFLVARLDKPRGIEIRVAAPITNTPQATYSVADVRALEQQFRTAYTEGRTLALHFLFLPGEYDQSSNVLGFAYRNTSMAVFEEKIQANSGGAFEPTVATVEGVVANHEVGHLLGLVNNGSPMQTEHQDEPNGHHCDDPGCLMYYAVRTTDFIANLLGGAPTLDQNCLDDLRANGGL